MVHSTLSYIWFSFTTCKRSTNQTNYKQVFWFATPNYNKYSQGHIWHTLNLPQRLRTPNYSLITKSLSTFPSPHPCYSPTSLLLLNFFLSLYNTYPFLHFSCFSSLFTNLVALAIEPGKRDHQLHERRKRKEKKKKTRV